MLRLAVVGSSGIRTEDKCRLEAGHVAKMEECVMTYIMDVLKRKTSDIILVSGGSAWGDHIAIHLFLKHNFAGIELYLASGFNINNKKYVNTHEGRVLNMLHAEFQKKTDIDSLDELSRVTTFKNTKTTRGFLQRYILMVKNIDYMIAFTFGDNGPIGSDVCNVWNRFGMNKIHYSL